MWQYLAVINNSSINFNLIFGFAKWLVTDLSLFVSKSLILFFFLNANKNWYVKRSGICSSFFFNWILGLDISPTISPLSKRPMIVMNQYTSSFRKQTVDCLTFYGEVRTHLAIKKSHIWCWYGEKRPLFFLGYRNLSFLKMHFFPRWNRGLLFGDWDVTLRSKFVYVTPSIQKFIINHKSGIDWVFYQYLMHGIMKWCRKLHLNVCICIGSYVT